MLCCPLSCRLQGLNVQHIKAELSTGKVYAHHHPDIQGRPVFVVKACRHMPGEHNAASTHASKAGLAVQQTSRV